MKPSKKSLSGVAIMSVFIALLNQANANVPAPAVAEELPFSGAVRVGNTLYGAGQIGSDGNDRLVPGGIVPETRQALSNIKAVIEGNGFSLKDVVKCTVFLADISEFSSFNEVYRNFFSKPYPARSTVAVAGLVANARVEIECIAAKRDT
ncbi:2-iminobutanoate/2-iminopropanoate deaminase [Pseudomonas asplenii]|uniref:2-iminobutanoate/2-iminopropanoate deaminase n=1 Tax=Pseudomonas asplenii TaxID=53407 RepID=A0A1H1XR48_9PSED|nr:Rid family detoxifying hydrolase [Pseudomonas asplenii]SDT11718.1 2-iminobutanoate/2-iminopropanoate deaminase [Pseudomonas asplenii]